MINVIELVIFVVLFYIFGSLPLALIFTYFTRQRDLRQAGTKNIGVANAYAIGGKLAGTLTLLGEIAKAALPIAAGFLYFDDNPWVKVGLIMAAILGTCFSIFLKGRGGLGNTIFLWSILIWQPWAAIGAGALSFLISILIKKSYLATVITRLLIIPAVLFLLTFDRPLTILALSSGILFTLIYRPSKDDFARQSMGARLRAFFSPNRYLFPLTKIKDKKILGGKGANLLWLHKFGWRVPPTWVLTADTLATLNQDNVSADLKKEIAKTLDPKKTYAVRSSADAEDAAEHSFAGQFRTELNIPPDQIIASAARVARSTQAETVKNYQAQLTPDIKSLQLSVIIQEMIQPVFSGVAFTKSPLTGLDEIVIEDIPGQAAKLVQGEVTPDRWVYKWGRFAEQPEQPKFPDQDKILAGLARDCRIIERQYRRPVDIEWAYDGREIYWIQLRPITALTGINIYSNKISREFLPGLIKPLVWSINIPLVNGCWKKIFVKFLGQDAQPIRVESLAKSFYHRAYFNMGIVGDLFELFGMRRETLELLLGLENTGEEKPHFIPGFRIFKYLPRGLWFFLTTMFGYRRQVERRIDWAKKQHRQLALAPEREYSEAEILSQLEKIMALNAEMVYYNIITPLLMFFRMNNLKNYLSPRGLTLDDLAPYFPKDQETDPELGLAALHEEYQRQLKKFPADQTLKIKDWLARPASQPRFKKIFADWLQNFGHIGESNNDFSLPTWRENQEIVWDLIKNFRPPRSAPSDQEQKIKSVTRKFVFKNARAGQWLKQRVSFYYTKGYFLLRPYFQRLGARLAARQALAHPADIWFLTYSEIKEIVAGKKSPTETINQRRQSYLADAKIKAAIPETIFGDNPPPLNPPPRRQTFTGLPAARGYYEGRVRKITTARDQENIKPGEVVVLSHTDIGLNQACIRSKALISISGGILSHCAIVAREYRIPAVVSVKEADQLQNGQLVAVDGHLGKVSILE